MTGTELLFILLILWSVAAVFVLVLLLKTKHDVYRILNTPPVTREQIEKRKREKNIFGDDFEEFTKGA